MHSSILISMTDFINFITYIINIIFFDIISSVIFKLKSNKLEKYSRKYEQYSYKIDTIKSTNCMFYLPYLETNSFTKDAEVTISKNAYMYSALFTEDKFSKISFTDSNIIIICSGDRKKIYFLDFLKEKEMEKIMEIYG